MAHRAVDLKRTFELGRRGLMVQSIAKRAAVESG